MMFASVLPAARQAQAATEVSLDFFYDNLASDGNWLEVADYGYVWQPNVGVSNQNWRPYSDGYWAYTDVGWTWVSYEDFGWATYHYGRWARLADQGWVWVPGERPVWGPAWVSWRTGGDYIGWAPLPPGGERVYEGRPISGHVDVEFDIGPAYYNFVDVRYIGEPVLRDRIFNPSQNITYINNTVNVTNITYNNSTVYNYGPDYNTLSAYSTRPIQRLTLQRDTNFNPSAGVSTALQSKVQGDRLMVAAPTIQKSAQPIAPKNVKEKIAQPKFEHGWSGIKNQKEEAQLKQKMKSEDAKAITPPTFKPREGSNAAALSAPAGSPAGAATGATAPEVSTAPRAPAAPVTAPNTGRGQNKRNNQAKPFENASPGATPSEEGQPSAVPEMRERGQGRRGGQGKRGERQPGVTPPASTPAEASTPTGQGAGAPVTPDGNQPRGKNKRDRERGRGAVETAPTPGTESIEQPNPNGNGNGGNRGKRGERRAEQAPAPDAPNATNGPAGTMNQGAAVDEQRGQRRGQGEGPGQRRREQVPPGAGATGQPNAQGAAADEQQGQRRGPVEGRGQRRREQGLPEAAGANGQPANPQGARGDGRSENRGQKKNKAQPGATVSPSPAG